jgi:hypothetical protein
MRIFIERSFLLEKMASDPEALFEFCRNFKNGEKNYLHYLGKIYKIKTTFHQISVKQIHYHKKTSMNSLFHFLSFLIEIN